MFLGDLCKLFTVVAVTYSNIFLSMSLFLDSSYFTHHKKEGDSSVFIVAKGFGGKEFLVPVSESIYSKK